MIVFENSKPSYAVIYIVRKRGVTDIENTYAEPEDRKALLKLPIRNTT